MRLEGVVLEIEHQKKECKHKIYDFLRTYHIDEELSPSLLPELFTRLRLIQNQQIQLDQMEGKLEEVSKNLRDLERRAQSLVKSQLVNDILFHQLREIYLKEKKRLEEEQSTLSKITKLQEKLNELELLLNAQEQQITMLFKEAGVSTESDFYQAHVVSQARAALEKELEHVRMQLGDRQVNINDFEEGFERTVRETLEAMKEKVIFF